MIWRPSRGLSSQGRSGRSLAGLAAAWLTTALCLTAGCGSGDTDKARATSSDGRSAGQDEDRGSPIDADASGNSVSGETNSKKRLADARRAPAPRPLDKALTIAKKALDELNEVDDYTCTFVKRERVDGELLDEQKLEMKVRHEPFSVYMRFLAPDSLEGQQAMYVEGANDNKLLGRAAGLRGKILGWLSLNPSGYLAMMGNRHPITDAGMKNLVAELMELGTTPGLLDDCRVSFRSGAKIDGRACTRLEIKNSKVQDDFKLAIARIWIDKERNIPLRFEAYEWPDGASDAGPEGGAVEPVLVEQYTYRDLEIDVGLSDRDFEVENPDYAGE